ncbi:ethanolamine utilization protein [Proteiniclasticum ruminis]|uniref:Ethanolamine utilization protein n=2 Tax=Proteiniclasticum ruminis TaxID=398199 RepID=A0A1I4XJX9_9CLOT|nr:ethanolamine utilization protein [Proteiniclasticum ruminis]
MEEIIRKVLEELKSLEEKNGMKKKMMVLSRDAASCEKITNRFSDTYIVTFAESFREEDAPDALMLKDLSPDHLMLLAEGKNGCLGPVMEWLMAGKPVYLEVDSLVHVQKKETCKKALFDLYESAVKRLESYGVLLVKEEKKFREAPGSGKGTERTLVTESEVKKWILKGEKTICVTKQTLITPLAKDLMKEYGICTVVKEGGEDHADR